VANIKVAKGNNFFISSYLRWVERRQATAGCVSKVLLTLLQVNAAGYTGA
jgi:hypothetical protein